MLLVWHHGGASGPRRPAETPAVPHGLNTTHPEHFNRALLEFLG